jgi:hypothetical protein
MTQTTQIAVYKDRKYNCLYVGNTKFGRRAKLAFFDGSKEFWVDAGKITVTSPAPATRGFSRRRPSCWTCRDEHDGGTICPDCGQED